MKTALVIDDQHDIVTLLSEVLIRKGFEVYTAENGMDGLHKVQVMDFDVIICDILMPRLGGAELYQRVQKEKPWLMKHFIFISGHSWMSGANDFLVRTGAKYIEKPLSIDSLMKAIDLVLSGN